MKNFEIAIRNLKRNRINSAIIIISLSLGFATLSLITTFLSRELRTDNFHTDKDRIYSIMCDNAFQIGNKTYNIKYEAEEYIKTNFAQVEDICTYDDFRISGITIENNDIANDIDIIATGSNFFNFFSYPLLTGNPDLVLESSSDIVISDKLARKFFGKESPIGKTIEIEKPSKKILYNITGIFKKTNQSSQLNFDMVVKIEPDENRSRRGYVKLMQTSSVAEVQSLFSKFKTEIPITNGEIQGQYYLQSLKNTYFDTSRRLRVENSQSKTTVWIVASVGLLIMVLAIFNFLGIINYNLLERARNYSIYQLNGANKIQLIKTILTELFMLLAASFLTGMVLMVWILPVFNHLINTSINFYYTFQFFNLGLLLSVLLTAFAIVSLFVVFKLKSITGYSALKGTKINRNFQLPALNVFQLATTILLISASIIIIKQIKFINNRDIGIDKQVIDLSVPRDKGNKLGILKTKLLQYPSIKNASVTTTAVLGPSAILLHYEDKNAEKHAFTSTNFIADEDYVETLGLKVIKGENFSTDPSMNKWKCLINESLAKELNIEDLTNAKIPAYDRPIIGIVEDFNYRSLRSNISPAFIQWDGINWHLLERALHILVKTSDNGGVQSISDIKQTWEEVFPYEPFEYETVEQQYLKLHADNNKTIQLITLCCSISILLSMMGLFAVVLQNSKLRTKEIGIRKVNGAKVSEILAILNKDFVKWVAIAFVIATPVAYYAMSKWLENFAYKASLSWWIFALAGLLALGIALLTVSWQSWKAATRNPVEALRYE